MIQRLVRPFPETGNIEGRQDQNDQNSKALPQTRKGGEMNDTQN